MEPARALDPRRWPRGSQLWERAKTVSSVWRAQYTVVALNEKIILLYVPKISSFSSLPSLKTGVESNNNFFLL